MFWNKYFWKIIVLLFFNQYSHNLVIQKKRSLKYVLQLQVHNQGWLFYSVWAHLWAYWVSQCFAKSVNHLIVSHFACFSQSGLSSLSNEASLLPVSPFTLFSFFLPAIFICQINICWIQLLVFSFKKGFCIQLALEDHLF